MKVVAEPERIDLPPDGQLLYWPDFYPPETADELFERLGAEISWQQYSIRLFGRSVAQPRLTAFYGNAGLRYTYSGLSLTAPGWGRGLARVREDVAEATGRTHNSVLCNLYRDGADAMGWHADDEPELGDEPVIASLSLGAERRFSFKPRAGGKSLKIDLANGSLLVMAGSVQAHWLHQLPRTRRPVGPRINLTFRTISGRAGPCC